MPLSHCWAKNVCQAKVSSASVVARLVSININYRFQWEHDNTAPNIGATQGSEFQGSQFDCCCVCVSSVFPMFIWISSGFYRFLLLMQATPCPYFSSV